MSKSNVKLVYSRMVSIDGFIAGPSGQLDWPIIDDELHTFVNEQQANVGGHLYGRKTWEVMSGFWPNAGREPGAPAIVVEFARIWNHVPKVVFSKTLDSVGHGARLVREVVPDEIETLKANAGGDLWLGGSGLGAVFLRLGLVDEIELLVHPIVLGRGIPMFPQLETRNRMKLTTSRTFASGVVHMRYVRE